MKLWCIFRDVEGGRDARFNECVSTETSVQMLRSDCVVLTELIKQID